MPDNPQDSAAKPPSETTSTTDIALQQDTHGYSISVHGMNKGFDHVDPESINAVCNEFARIANHLGSVADTLPRIANRLDQAWQSASSPAAQQSLQLAAATASALADQSMQMARATDYAYQYAGWYKEHQPGVSVGAVAHVAISLGRDNPAANAATDHVVKFLGRYNEVIAATPPEVSAKYNTAGSLSSIDGEQVTFVPNHGTATSGVGNPSAVSVHPLASSDGTAIPSAGLSPSPGLLGVDRTSASSASTLPSGPWASGNTGAGMDTMGTQLSGAGPGGGFGGGLSSAQSAGGMAPGIGSASGGVGSAGGAIGTDPLVARGAGPLRPGAPAPGADTASQVGARRGDGVGSRSGADGAQSGRSGVPMHQGGHGPGDSAERSRSTWLTEDPDVWAPPEAPPSVIGG